MAEDLFLAFAESLGWVIAGVAGAAFAKHELLERNIRYLVGYPTPVILMLVFVE